MLIFSHGYLTYYVHGTALALYIPVITFSLEALFIRIPRACSTKLKEEISQKYYREIKSANTLPTMLRTLLDLTLIRKRRAHIFIIFPTTPNIMLYLIGVCT